MNKRIQPIRVTVHQWVNTFHIVLLIKCLKKSESGKVRSKCAVNGCDNLVVQGNIVFVKYCIVNNVVKQNAVCKYGG